MREVSLTPKVKFPCVGCHRSLCTQASSARCSITVVQSMKLGIDVNRHKEIIVKSISALLLLLLKHFKLNHIYQVSSPEGRAQL